MPRRIGYSVRKLPSGRYQALVRADDGKQVGIGTWERREDAEIAAQDAARDVRRRQWVDPRASDIPLSMWLDEWLQRKLDAGEHGRHYAPEARRMVDKRIGPTLGNVFLTDLTTGMIARWHSRLKAERIAATARDGAPGRPGIVPAKSYRLLHAALEAAVREQLLPSNPCTVPGAGREDSPERPLLTSQQVAELAAAIEPRFSAMVLLAGWGGLRQGELARLLRSDVDILHGTVNIRVAKSRAGVRIVHMPPQLTAVMDRHLATFTAAAADAPVFTGPQGGLITGPMVMRVFGRAREACGLPHIHLHDLRHHAGTMTAVSGATQREIMARLGHSSTSAAIRYQHAASSRAREVAAALGAAWVEPTTEAATVRRIK